MSETKYNYKLDIVEDDSQPVISTKAKTGQTNSWKKIWKNIKDFSRFIKDDGKKLPLVFLVIVIDSAASVITPYLIAKAVDDYITLGDVIGLKNILLILGGIYIVTVFTGYIQGMLMGMISQRTLFRLREALFSKIQELPIAFFNQNKAGDLMSRVNNDADKVNQFLSESLARFVGIMSMVLGIGIFVFFINIYLSIAMLLMVVFIILFTKTLAGWAGKRNKRNLAVLGNFNAVLQENLTNFRVIVAYGKRNYFKSYLNDINAQNKVAAIKSEVATKIFEPTYEFAGAISVVLVILTGVYLISIGQTTIGVLIAFISYTQRFYDPLRTLAVIFGSFQKAVAAWSRITEIFDLKDNLQIIPQVENYHNHDEKNLKLELKNVSFSYEENMKILENINLQFESGKTYALVGPTGGGKSTLASLMSRLYDPDEGEVIFDNRDIRSYTKEERAKKISVILQDPILFTGTVIENLRYGNELLKDKTDNDIENEIIEKGLEEVIKRFDQGLQSKISQSSGGGLSLGQRQLISFMRAILRKPELLILDEATANIDTVTEAILEKALKGLPKTTTKVVIAHRLNTIREADEIMFVNGHHVTKAGDLDDAISLIKNAQRKS